MWGGAQYCGLGWVFNFISRGEIRTKYNLKGDVASDCLFSWCCPCCGLMQQEKEVIARSSGMGGNQGYVAPTGMVASPQQA